MPGRSISPVLHFLVRHGSVPDGAGLTDGHLLERFARHGDEPAFAALVQRHGPMVLGVCRRLLRDVHDAEDAFQATFLLLVRKAGSLRQPERLGAWLHGVAQRTALKAKMRAARRQSRSRPLEDRPNPAARDDLIWRDLRPVLDDAIRRLPTRYRVPFVLCYLEGLTNAQAARQLGCPPGTIATRLARAREQLRTRLTRQGVTLSTGALFAALAGRTASAKIPPALLGATARLAAGAAGPGAAAVVPVPVLTLMKGVSTGMFMDKVKILVVALISVAGIGAGVLAFPALGDEPPTALEPPRPVVTAPATVQPVVDNRFPNFQVDAPTRRTAQLVAEAAERHRKESALRWLGKELPPWPVPCRIQVEILSGGGTSGATSFTFDKGKVTSQRMALKGSLESLLASALPHEVTHTVWAHAFGAPVPRWADEGAALLSEDDDERQRHERLARQILSTPERKISVRRLMAMHEFPADTMALYAEGYSLARFLVERKDHRRFLTFVKQGGRDGWDRAVRAHYGFANVDALEDAWIASLNLGQSKSDHPDQSLNRGQYTPDFPDDLGPAPTTAKARMGEDGRIYIYCRVASYRPRTEYVEAEGYYSPVTPVTTYAKVSSDYVAVYGTSEVQAFGTDGQRIDAKALRDRLQKPVTVLVSQDGRPVSSFYLQIVKEGTLILVPPEPKAPSAPPAPAASAPRVQGKGH